MPELHAVHHRQAILIAGGGVAALEALLALRALLGPTVKIELVAPDPQFTYRPITVAEPFDLGEVTRIELAHFVAENHASYRSSAVSAVDPSQRAVRTADGDTLTYDYLVVAVGARAVPAVEGAISFDGAHGPREVRAVLEEIESGAVRRVVFAAPARTTWLLPIYELALFTAQWAEHRGLSPHLTILTEETCPLEAFGAAASEAVAGLLAASEIEVLGGHAAERFDGRALVGPGMKAVAADAVIALPRLAGRTIPGLPHDEQGFIPIDRHAAVRGCRQVYAAGDGVAFPIKQGGLAAQQADAAAEAIAASLGAVVRPRPFRPILRGQLLTGGQPRYLRLSPAEGGERSEISFRPLWWPPTKIAGRYLGPYLQAPDEPALVREQFADRDESLSAENPDEEVHSREEATDLLFELAEANARRGSYRFALRCLDAAEEVSGPLSAEHEAARKEWRQALREGR